MMSNLEKKWPYKLIEYATCMPGMLLSIQPTHGMKITSLLRKNVLQNYCELTLSQANQWQCSFHLESCTSTG